MDEVFGAENFLATFIWQQRCRRRRTTSRTSRGTTTTSSSTRAIAELWSSSTCCLEPTEHRRARTANPDNDPRGPWRSGRRSQPGAPTSQRGTYPITTPSGRVDRGRRPAGVLAYASRESIARSSHADEIVFVERRDRHRSRSSDLPAEVRRGRDPAERLARHRGRSQRSDAKQRAAQASRSARRQRLRHPEADAADPTDAAAGDDRRRRTTSSSTSSPGRDQRRTPSLQQNAEDGGNRRFICGQLPGADARLATTTQVRRLGHHLRPHRRGRWRTSSAQQGFGSYRLGREQLPRRDDRPSRRAVRPQRVDAATTRSTSWTPSPPRCCSRRASRSTRPGTRHEAGGADGDRRRRRRRRAEPRHHRRGRRRRARARAARRRVPRGRLRRQRTRSRRTPSPTRGTSASR